MTFSICVNSNHEKRKKNQLEEVTNENYRKDDVKRENSNFRDEGIQIVQKT